MSSRMHGEELYNFKKWMVSQIDMEKNLHEIINKFHEEFPESNLTDNALSGHYYKIVRALKSTTHQNPDEDSSSSEVALKDVVTEVRAYTDNEVPKAITTCITKLYDLYEYCIEFPRAKRQLLNYPDLKNVCSKLVDLIDAEEKENELIQKNSEFQV